jgi:hypothetical protein
MPNKEEAATPTENTSVMTTVHATSLLFFRFKRQPPLI